MTFDQQQQPYYADTATPQAALAGRAKFIERTYIHLAGAIALFVALEAVLLNSPASKMALQMMSSSTSWLIVLGLFMLVGTVATHMAQAARSKPMQYLGLGLYVVLEAIIFLPLLLIAQYFSGPENNIILTAGVTTLATFAALTTAVARRVGPALDRRVDGDRVRARVALVGVVERDRHRRLVGADHDVRDADRAAVVLPRAEVGVDADVGADRRHVRVR